MVSLHCIVHTHTHTKLTFEEKRSGGDEENSESNRERSAPRGRHVGHLLETGGATSPRDGLGWRDWRWAEEGGL